MDIEISREKDNRMEFLLKGAPVPFANLIRRYGIGQVSIFAIDQVTIYENSSSIFDEYLAHRLGQVPLLSDASRAADEIVFTLDSQGPSNVMSKDLKSSDSKIKASIDNIPLLKLLEGQNVRLEAKARKGIGRMHAKFQPGILSYEILKPNELRFKVESFMQLPPRELLSKAAEVVITRCEELEEKLSEIKKEKD
jgi:DNA-directed RNA polymerase subunit D